MKTYIKPTIEFIELKPEERLACESGYSNCGGCCSGGGGGGNSSFWMWCHKSFPYGKWCDFSKFLIWYCG